MDETQKAFIRRHLQVLIDKGVQPEQALKESLIILSDSNESKKILDEYKQNKSLIKTLQSFKIVEFDNALLETLAQLEKRRANVQFDFNHFLQADQKIDQLLALYKTKLRFGLGYALWLSFFAIIVISVVQAKVLPQFESLFIDFGVDLPELTQMAVNWQNSILSPAFVGVLMMALLGFMLFLLRSRSLAQLIFSDSFNAKIFRAIPFTKSIVDYLKSIRWFAGLRCLAANQQSLEQSINLLPAFPTETHKSLPEFESSLRAAEKINTLLTEIDFQQEQLEFMAEGIVTKATTKLTAGVMVFVVGYIAFVLIASYLPIFQLGAIV